MAGCLSRRSQDARKAGPCAIELAQALYLQGQAMSKDPKAAPTAPALFLLQSGAKAVGRHRRERQQPGGESQGAQRQHQRHEAGRKDSGRRPQGLRELLSQGAGRVVQDEESRRRACRRRTQGAGEVGSASASSISGKCSRHWRAASCSPTPRRPRKAWTTPAILLATGYLLAGDLYRAAVAGEDLARSRAADQARGPGAPATHFRPMPAFCSAINADANADASRIWPAIILSPAMQKYWASEPVTSVARYQLAMLCNKDNDYQASHRPAREADAGLHRVHLCPGPTRLHRRGGARQGQDGCGQESVRRQGAQGDSAHPQPAQRCRPATAAMYFFARLELARFYYADAAQALEKKELAQSRGRLRRDGKVRRRPQGQARQDTESNCRATTRGKLEFSMKVMGEYAHLGQAELDYRKGNYDKVLQNDRVGRRRR